MYSGKSFRLNLFAAATYILFNSLSAASAHDHNNTDNSNLHEQSLEAVLVKAPHQDELRNDDVFGKNVSNLYLGRDYLERYRIDAAGDIFKGLNGVYNMNTRNAGSAITPNIRGISGKGRIPVTIDGTEQTIDVWMNNYGVADRNYVDPTLFRSISVEKGTSMSPGVKSGIGGAVSIRTIEAADIVPKGKTWGIQLKGEFSNNSLAPSENVNALIGRDYRTLEGNPTADGASGMIEGSMPFTSLVFHQEGSIHVRPQQGSKWHNFAHDRQLFFSGAFKTPISDGLIAFSDRKKGTYLSGKKGYQGYLNNPNPNNDDDPRSKLSDALYPNMAQLYRPGEQVPNSNVASRSLLLKNRWYLPNRQNIGWQYMDNKIRFGEMNPFINSILLGYSNTYNMFANRIYDVAPTQGIDSHIRSRTYKLSYNWQPANSPWIDLSANLWRTQTESERHQSGGPDLAVLLRDSDYNSWARCFRHHIPPESGMPTCEELREAGYDANRAPSGEPPIAGAYNVYAGSQQYTKATRNGFDIRNRMAINDKFTLNASAYYQHEKLHERTMMAENDKDIFGVMNAVTALTKMTGPRDGSRQEWGGQLAFDWKPTPRLNIQGGIRYDAFRATDDLLVRERKRRNPDYSITWSNGEEGRDHIITGLAIPYLQLMTPEEIKLVQDYQAANDQDPEGWEQRYNDFVRQHDFIPNYISRHNRNGNTAYLDNEGNAIEFPESETALYRAGKPVIVPYRNRKFMGPAFPDGFFTETVSNPQGKQGNFRRHLIAPVNAYDYNNHGFWGYISERVPDYIENGDAGIGQVDMSNPESHTPNTVVDSGPANFIHTPVAEENLYPIPKPLRAEAFSPALSLSYGLSDNSRLHLRWANAVRFPSLYESTNLSFGAVYLRPMQPDFALKPERSTNWEVGYSWNFAPYWKKLQRGDIRLTYFHTTVKNVIDSAANKDLIQYDRKVSSGIELQSRIDTGSFFASLGATYRLKQQTCDANLRFAYDIFFNSIPECFEGGIGATRFYQSVQPKYSINIDSGVRLFDKRLELGVRGIYHSRRDSRQYDDMIRAGRSAVFDSTGYPHHWHSSLVWDAYAHYRIKEHLEAHLGITNLTNRYYLDPISNVPVPAPGRTITFGIKAKF